MIPKLNSRSCVLDSFAFILDYTPEEMAEMVGHDGDEGYHSQELIEVALRCGYAVTAIERKPVAQNPEDMSMRLVEFPKWGAEARFGDHMFMEQGVLLGRTGFDRKPHAVAWRFLRAYDPAIDQEYGILTDGGSLVPDDINFIPMTFLRIDEL